MNFIKTIIISSIISEVKHITMNNSPSGDFYLDFICSGDDKIIALKFVYAKYNDPNNTGPNYYKRDKSLDIIDDMQFTIEEITENIDLKPVKKYCDDKYMHKLYLDSAGKKFAREVFFKIRKRVENY